VFYNRIDAGEHLATALKKYQNQKNAVVIALPRGGVVPGYIVARALQLPLEVAMVKKLGHPTNPEYAIGAVSLKGIVLNGSPGVSDEYIEQATANIQELLRKRYALYHGNKPPIKLKNKIAIVVDDGVATGKTIIASLELITQEEPEKIVAAVPVGPASTISLLRQYADEVICLETPHDFYAIGSYYKEFGQVSDQQVMELLKKANWATPS
jgi:predicted phosphoribosyltransferase